MIVIPEIEKE